MSSNRCYVLGAILAFPGLAGPLTAAQHETKNFCVEAPTPALARQVGEAAERCRRDLARQWLGRELPDWDTPCPLQVKVTIGRPGGFTALGFVRDGVVLEGIQVEGSVDRLLAGVVPHEVTHTVFACHFRCPVPRWADEGASVLAEDEQTRKRHERLVREVIDAPARLIPLRRLFALDDYPEDRSAFYVQASSVSCFLVKKGGRKTFLAFIQQAKADGWDTALKTHYGYTRVEELETEWVASLATSHPARGSKVTQGRGSPPPGDPSCPSSVPLRASPLPKVGESISAPGGTNR